MGNKVSHKDQAHVTNTRKRFEKNKKSIGSKSVDSFLEARKDEIVERKNISQVKNVTKLEVKIFRSYTNLNEFGSKGNIFNDKPANIRIYKKNTQKFDYNTYQENNDGKIFRPISRCNSLPKTFGKSKGARHSVASTSSNGIVNSLKDGRSSRTSLQDRYSNSYQVAKEDFVSSQTLEERLIVFERKLVEAILSKLTSFSLPFQTSLIPLALFPPSDESSLRAHSLLTLKCYLEDKSDHRFDPIESSLKSQCAIFVSPSSLEGLASLSHEPDDESISNFARAIFLSMSQEAARDLGRMYEYQIGLLTSDLSISILTSYIADRIVSYITHDMKVPLVDRNSLLLGALRGRTNKKNLPPAVVSVILGKRELKWDIYEIMDKPGMRKSFMVSQDCEILRDGPFQFYTSSSSDYMTYGYRGQVFELDFSRGVYKPNKSEVSDFGDDVLWRYDDIHRDYPPHFHLVGDLFFKRFLAERGPAQTQQDLVSFTSKCLSLTAYAREDIAVTLIPLSRADLSDESICDFTDPHLIQRIPKHLLLRQFTQHHHPGTPTPSGDIPTSGDLLAPLQKCMLTSTPSTGQDGPDSFGALVDQSLASLDDPPQAF